VGALKRECVCVCVRLSGPAASLHTTKKKEGRENPEGAEINGWGVVKGARGNGSGENEMRESTSGAGKLSQQQQVASARSTLLKDSRLPSAAAAAGHAPFSAHPPSHFSRPPFSQPLPPFSDPFFRKHKAQLSRSGFVNLPYSLFVLLFAFPCVLL